MIPLEKLPENLVKKLETQYQEEDRKRILEGYKGNRYVTLRVNTLKKAVDQIKTEFNQFNIDYEEVPFYQAAFVIKNKTEKELEELEMYQKGEIYLQSLSSMIPPMVLDPKQGEDILDMTAAPGGKTTQIAAMVKNNANITACEMNAIRMERLKYNIEKQGASCVYTMQTDARNLDNFFSFDRILLDAPCTGSGTIQVGEKFSKAIFEEEKIRKITIAQKKLLKKALNLLKPGMEMVYSTCSILKEENEEVLEEILKQGKTEIVPIELTGIEKVPLLPTKIKGTICVCPNSYYEGFFVAKIRKVAPPNVQIASQSHRLK